VRGDRRRKAASRRSVATENSISSNCELATGLRRTREFELERSSSIVECATGQVLPEIANRADDDAQRVKALADRGTRLEGEHIVAWFPERFSRTEADALVSRLDPAAVNMSFTKRRS
jgi:hypothetical protein